MKNIFLTGWLLIAFTINAQELTPTDTEALLSVFVKNTKGKSLEGESISFVGKKSGKTYSGITDASGSFKLLVPEGETYKVKYKAFTESKDYKDIDIPSMEGIVEFDYTLTISDLPKTFTLKDVFYDTGKSTLRSESFKELNTLAEFMNLKKSLVIEVAGHTDNVGGKEANQKLSEGRSNSVRNYLIKKGIAGERLVAKGYGDTQPVADNTTDEGKQKNRRTEVRIISQ